MKTTNKGKLAITIDGNGNPYVIFEPVNGTVWLYKSELPSLFCVTIQVIKAGIDSIVKENIIDVEKSSKYELYIGCRRIKYDVREVSLDIIIALAFRIDSPNAKFLREWFIEQLLCPKLINLHIPIFTQHHGWN
jgi:hypothetical protein